VTAKDKLEEAWFFLKRMRSTDLLSLEFKFYVSACASAMYGSIGHLLYDYAKKYWHTLDTSDFLDARYFLLLAKTTNQPKALQFVQWYNELPARIRSNPDASEVWRIRHIDTHRGSPGLNFVVEIFEPLDVTDRLQYGVMRPSGTFEPSGSSPPTIQQINAVPNSSVAVFLCGYESKQVSDVFGSAWDFLKSVVDEAEQRFGST